MSDATSTSGRVALLVARDPWTLVAAWDIAAASRLRALRALGPRAVGASPALRVVCGGVADRPIDLPPTAAQWIIDAAPARTYTLEVGLRMADGTFTALVCSLPVTTPPEVPSSDTSVTWIRADQPGTPIAAPWSGRRVPPVVLPRRGGPSSDGHS